MSFVDLVWILLFFGIFMGFDWIQVLGLKPKDPSRQILTFEFIDFVFELDGQDGW